MATVISKPEVIRQAKLGENLKLKWTIKNTSKKDWPAKPLLRNFSGDIDLNDREIDTILSSQQLYEIVYEFTMPLNFKEKFFTLNLHLVDPLKKERFGDAMIAIIEVLPGIK